MKRRRARTVRVGNVAIGGRHPVAIQSMTKTHTSDIEATVRQIRRLSECGCEIVRLAVKTDSDALALSRIKRRVKVPLVADIHFQAKLALLAIEHGADKIRLNPGNIRKQSELRRIVSALKQARIPLRIGVNSGSVETAGVSARKKMPRRLVDAALAYARRIEKLGYDRLVLSLKASTVVDTIEAYRQAAAVCDYPLHLGMTATGTSFNGAIKSGIALGGLLLEGIGDTIRVSLTDKPETEVYAAQSILEAVRQRRFGPEVISCPTCGRCEVDLVHIVKEAQEAIKKRDIPAGGKPLRIALMGCVVNGPGEAKEADIGIAFGKSGGMLFKGGKALRKVTLKESVKALFDEIRKREL